MNLTLNHEPVESDARWALLFLSFSRVLWPSFHRLIAGNDVFIGRQYGSLLHFLFESALRHLFLHELVSMSKMFVGN